MLQVFVCLGFSARETRRSQSYEEPRIGLSHLNDGTDRRRVPLQDKDHPGNNPHLVPDFPRLCSGMFPERFWSASVSVGSREIRLV